MLNLKSRKGVVDSRRALKTQESMQKSVRKVLADVDQTLIVMVRG